jgi:hypothetical protein
VGTGAYPKVRDIFFALGVVAVFLALIAGAVFGLDDEELFVSPPESVAEQFVELLAFGRAGPARRLLTHEAERATSIEELLRVSARLRHRYGAVDDVSTLVDERRRDTLILRVVIRGSRMEGELLLPTVREQGQWVVARPSALLPDAEEPNPR